MNSLPESLQPENSPPKPLVAVDIGNTRTKFGLFPSADPSLLPHPHRAFSWGPDWDEGQLDAWLGDKPERFTWRVGSVNHVGLQRVMHWLDSRGAIGPQVLGIADFPVISLVDEPTKVGVDRLANVLAVNQLRTPNRPAIIVSLGTAITVDLVSPAGESVGGAIMPGMGMSARALHEFTDLLPLEPVWELTEPPSALGKTTRGCLQAGLFWGAIGGVRELIDRLTDDDERPQIFVTGGGGPTAVGQLTRAGDEPAVLVPHLTLSGIAMATPPS